VVNSDKIAQYISPAQKTEVWVPTFVLLSKSKRQNIKTNRKNPANKMEDENLSENQRSNSIR
jgi:hypothetical protein